VIVLAAYGHDRVLGDLALSSYRQDLNAGATQPGQGAACQRPKPEPAGRDWRPGHWERL